MASAIPSLDSLLNPGELLASTVDTKCPYSTLSIPVGYSFRLVVETRLRSLSGEENGEHQETKERPKEAGVQSQSKTGVNK